MLKHKAKSLRIKEQYINDMVSELTLIFEVTPSGEGRLCLYGDNLPFGNRDFQFSREGKLLETGTATNSCKGV